MGKQCSKADIPNKMFRITGINSEKLPNVQGSFILQWVQIKARLTCRKQIQYRLAKVLKAETTILNAGNNRGEVRQENKVSSFL